MSGTWRRGAGWPRDLDASAGIRTGLQIIGEAADAKVPVDSGDLRDSQTIAVQGNAGGIGYRDPKAVAAHENLTVRLRGGRQAKYLEAAFTESRAAVLEAIAADLRHQLGGGSP